MIMVQSMKKLKVSVSFLIGSIFYFSSCEVKKYPEVNTNVNQEVFTKAMAELVLLESFYTTNYKVDSISPHQIDSISKVILKKYNLTIQEYVDAQNEFVKNPEINLQIQENALEIIQKQKDSLDIKQKEAL